ncbi:MAG TPA: hypothetical protein VHV52_14655 [Gaiellaceae bacterium]|nr:hypothetical protein [Gaiellaceae bacterium]
MSFFEPPPALPEPPERPPTPEWVGAPDNVRPEPFPLAETLVRTDAVFIQVYAGLAFPKGFEFSFQLVRREARQGRHDNPIHSWHEVQRGGELEPEQLRFGIQDAAGGKATVFGRRFPPREDPPTGPILSPNGGGGGMHRYDMRFWVWPIPPPGPFAFVVEWPSEGVELTRVEIDSEPIREAAARAEELWPGGPDAGGRSSGTSFMHGK